MRIGRVVPAALATVIAAAGAAGVITATSASASGAHAAMTASTLSLKSTKLGKILVNSAGKTVYIFALDKKGSNKTACNTACLAVWPLVTTTGKATAGTGVNAKLITTFKVGSQTEVAYNGYPLYTYLGDTAAGDTNGQAKNLNGGLWYVIGAAGTPIK